MVALSRPCTPNGWSPDCDWFPALGIPQRKPHQGKVPKRNLPGARVPFCMFLPLLVLASQQANFSPIPFHTENCNSDGLRWFRKMTTLADVINVVDPAFNKPSLFIGCPSPLTFTPANDQFNGKPHLPRQALLTPMWWSMASIHLKVVLTWPKSKSSPRLSGKGDWRLVRLSYFHHPMMNLNFWQVCTG